MATSQFLHILQNWQHLFSVEKQIKAICIMLLVVGTKNEIRGRLFVLQGPKFSTDTRFIIDKNEFYKLSPFFHQSVELNFLKVVEFTIIFWKTSESSDSPKLS
jgi:hypothetical protein